MNIESQVCSLELAKRLKDLGVKQKSYFWWVDENIATNRQQIFFNGKEYCSYGCGCCENGFDANEFYSAYTVAELLNLIPAHIDIKKDEPFNYYHLHIKKRNAKNIQFIMNYYCDTYEPSQLFERILLEHNIYDESLCNCAAKMLIHLIEQGHVRVEDL